MFDECTKKRTIRLAHYDLLSITGIPPNYYQLAYYPSAILPILGVLFLGFLFFAVLFSLSLSLSLSLHSYHSHQQPSLSLSHQIQCGLSFIKNDSSSKKEKMPKFVCFRKAY